MATASKNFPQDKAYRQEEKTSQALAKLVFDNETLEILFANTEIAQLLGYTTNELLRLTVNDIIADELAVDTNSNKVIFPTHKVVRQFIHKEGKVIQCVSENCGLDFDSNTMIVYSVKELKDKGTSSAGSARRSYEFSSAIRSNIAGYKLI